MRFGILLSWTRSAFACISLLACRSENSSLGAREMTTRSGVRVDSGGISIVTYPLGQPDENRLSVVALGDLRVRIDSIPRAQQSEFHQLSGAAILDNGDLVLGHQSRNELLVFDSVGRFRATVGRSGSGPGEFRSISGPWSVSPNKFAVYDGSNRRTTFFFAPSSIVRGQRIGVETLPDSSFFIWKAFGVTQAQLTLLWVNGPPLKTIGMARPSMSLVAVDSTGAARRIGPLRPGLEQYVMAPPSERSFSLGISPFAASPLATSCGTKIAIADNQEFSVSLLNESGRISTIIRADTRARVATDSDYVAFARTYRTDKVITSDMIAPMKLMTPRGLLPVLRALYCDNAENIWVEEWPHDNGSRRRVTVFSADGSIRFALELPVSTQILGAKGLRVALAVVDDDGVLHVELRDIRADQR